MIAEALTLNAESVVAMYKTGEQLRDCLRLLRTTQPDVWHSILRTDAGLQVIMLTEHLEAVTARNLAEAA